MACMRTSTLIYSLINAAGSLFCLFVCLGIVHLTKQAELDSYDGASGITFSFVVLPVFLLCLLFNACWGVKALIDIFHRRDYQASVALGVVAAIWMAFYMFVRLVA